MISLKHIVKITKKPELTGEQSVPDGAVCGNGDLGLILGNAENGLRIFISKCDLWYAVESHDRGGLRPLGYIDIPVDAALYGNYYVEQDMDNGLLRCEFRNGKDECLITVFPNKTENSIMIELGGNVETEPEFHSFGIDGDSGEIKEDKLCGIYRRFEGSETVYPTSAYAFMKNLDDARFYIFAATNHDCDNPREAALKKAKSVGAKRFEALKNAHLAAWKEFWAKSSFECSDTELELGWYASQYLLAGCTGNKKFPPGLYANFVAVEYPSWHSDYHLNYNYQAPFYAACSSNHVEFTDCYHTPLEEFKERGRAFAAKYGCRGILYPVGLEPGGVLSEYTPYAKDPFERLFLGQKSNAIHPADIMVFRWNATRDKTYAALHAYPYIKDCLAFFEDYAVFEDGRYSVNSDAAHEVPFYRNDFSKQKYKRYIHDKNNALTLGLLRMCLNAALDMSAELGVDEEKRHVWQNMLDKLSPFATCLRFSKRVFRYTEKGQRWNDGNDVGQQHIYPCGCIGLLSDEKLLKIAKNTFAQREKYCWDDDNAVCSYYPMAARLGKDPAVIIEKLHSLSEKHRLPNMIYNFAGGCLETCPVYATTLNEMVLQSYEGAVRIFPCWKKSVDVSFKNLRADGAFLVSAAMKGGKVSDIKIESEAGGELKLINPFPKSIIEMSGKTLIADKKTITLPTEKGDVITVRNLNL